MIYGLYLSGQGAQVQSARQDVIANNLANTSTNAFKRDLATAQAHLPYDAQQGRPTWLPGNLDNLPGGVTTGETVTDFSQGAMTKTSSKLDVAIHGKGFLQVTDGKRKYLTRDGQLAINNKNELVTREHGFPVLSAGGSPIAGIEPEHPIEIHSDGAVTQGGNDLGRMAVIEPRRYADVSKFGKNLYTTTGTSKPAAHETELKQGYLEASGILPVAAITEMIESSRILEANVNLIHTQDESLDRLLQSLPRK
jgi:flagellar basal body rod protein FlgG